MSRIIEAAIKIANSTMYPKSLSPSEVADEIVHRLHEENRKLYNSTQGLRQGYYLRNLLSRQKSCSRSDNHAVLYKKIWQIF